MNVEVLWQMALEVHYLKYVEKAEIFSIFLDLDVFDYLILITKPFPPSLPPSSVTLHGYVLKWWFLELLVA